jgi:cephalosporin hydroxylase
MSIIIYFLIILIIHSINGFKFPSFLPLTQPIDQNIAYTIKIIQPIDRKIVLPGKLRLSYQIERVTTKEQPIDGYIAIAVDNRILAFQSTHQCLNEVSNACWLALSRYDIATMTGIHSIQVQIINESNEPISILESNIYNIEQKYLTTLTSTKYLKWWHEEAAIWTTVKWLGVTTQKLPLDMWNYQEIISAIKPSGVIETGTRYGGSALFFATLLGSMDSTLTPLYTICGDSITSIIVSCLPFVLSIDVDHNSVSKKVQDNRLIELLTTSSVSNVMRSKLIKMFQNSQFKRSIHSRLFVILDSDHSASHVFKELELFAEFLQSGDYLIVEDGIINGHPVEQEWGLGPFEAILKFENIYGLNKYFIHDIDREKKFGITQSPNGFLIRTKEPWSVGGDGNTASGKGSNTGTNDVGVATMINIGNEL